MKKLITFMLAGLITSFFLLQSSAWSKSTLLMQIPSILAASHRPLGSTIVNDNVIVIDDKNITDIISTSPNTGINGEVAVLVSGNTKDILQTGYILSILPGADVRFPFGMTGSIIGLLDDDQGRKIVILQGATYADVVKEAKLNIDNITLDSSNFVGVIAPSAVQPASSNMPMAMAATSVAGKDFYSFRNGAIIVGPSGSNRINSMLSTAAEDGAIPAGTVSLNIKVKPVEGANAEFVIKGSLDKIKLTAKKDISIENGFKSLDLRVDSDINFDVQLAGEGSIKFGYFAEAWEEVEEQEFSMLGVNAKLIGLSSKDKIGKFPLAGLVWSVPCSSLCPVTIGSTDTPLNQAKAMGVILWVYLTADGEITLDDESSLTFVHLNPAGLSLEINKTSDDLHLAGSLERNSGSGRLLEVLKLKGILNAQAEAGISLDADLFAFGVRVANAGADFVIRPAMQVSGEISYGTDGLYLPWSWDGTACFQSSIGAGAIFRGAAKFGVELNTSWKKISLDFEYENQIPTEDDIYKPGWHAAWYKKWL